MEKRKNEDKRGSSWVVPILVLLVLMVTGVLPGLIKLVIGLAAGFVGLVVGLFGGLIGLVFGLIGGLIGLVVGLGALAITLLSAFLPIILTVGLVMLIVRAVNGKSEKRKNDDIDYV